MTPFRADLMLQENLRARRGLVIAAVIVAALAFSAATAAGVAWRWAFSDMPSLHAESDALWAVRREPSVMLLGMNGEVLDVRGPLYARAVSLDELPEHVVQAFIAIEDRRFFEHEGVDWRAMARALWVNFRAGRTLEGGSTITMQLVKNLVLTPERSLRRKLQEMRLALALERHLSKTEILELYLNRIYLGDGAYGIEAAARRYFGKPAAELTLAEAALLAALPKAPSRLDPTANLAAAQARAAEVLRAMEDSGFITAEAREAAEAEPAEPAERGAGMEARVFGYVFDLAVAQAAQLLPGAPADLVIRTSIDPRLQGAAHEALNTQLEARGATDNAGQGALAALAPDGAIRAMAGGRDYGQTQFNRAVQARRQPGSSFKPIVFAAALEAGETPFSVYYDEPVDLAGWSPRNFGGGYRGRVTMREALTRSINTVAAQIGNRLGARAVAQMARRLGVASPLNEVPSIALGASEVTLLELTAAYAVFANDGLRREPWLIESIADTRGRELYRRAEPQDERAIDEAVARTMSTMLQDVVISGTGRRAALPGRAVAGKTGTSQSFRDAWFLGYTADYITGVWVGNDDDAPTNDVTGGALPAEIWRSFMLAAHDGLPARPLSAPPPRARSEREERLVSYYASLSASFTDVMEGRSGRGR
ncbi:MAG: PBP1A family penicillin-binding protein [Maricaulaceae bacterium]|nr:PBP1A family penicillin-binding protein [Maricaulaceae bacterium]